MKSDKTKESYSAVGSHYPIQSTEQITITKNEKDTLWKNSGNTLGNYCEPTIRLGNFLMIW